MAVTVMPQPTAHSTARDPRTIGRDRYSDSYPALLVDTERYIYAAWLERVDYHLEDLAGIGLSDLPDSSLPRTFYVNAYSARHAAARIAAHNGYRLPRDAV